MKIFFWKIACGYAVASFLLALGATVWEGVEVNSFGLHLPFRPNLVIGPLLLMYAVAKLRRKRKL